MEQKTIAKSVLVIGLFAILIAIGWGIWLEFTGVPNAASLLPSFILLPIGVGLLYFAKKQYKGA